jgi:hypothetical protein
MYSAIRLLGVAGLLAASTAHSQSPNSALLNHVPSAHSVFREVSPGTERLGPIASLGVPGERALLGRIEHGSRATEPAGGTNRPIDGAQALLGRPLSAAPLEAGASSARSSFLIEVRGGVSTNASGAAEFGAVPGEGGALTLSLGGRGQESAILFTRRGGTPLAEGRYRISDSADGADDVLALVMTGSPTSPTGVFRGRSGWLVVIDATDRVLTGHFHIDGVGFLAAEPAVEDRTVKVTGRFSARARTTALATAR